MRANTKFNSYFNFPCKDCQERQGNCYDTCQKYLDAKKVHERWKAERKYRQIYVRGERR